MDGSPFTYDEFIKPGSYPIIYSRPYEIELAINLYFHHCYLYYVHDAPEINDYQFDKLFKRIKALLRLYPELLRANMDPRTFVGSTRHESYPTHIRDYFERTYVRR